jgi:hypothetical protein
MNKRVVKVLGDGDELAAELLGWKWWLEVRWPAERQPSTM